MANTQEKYVDKPNMMSIVAGLKDYVDEHSGGGGGGGIVVQTTAPSSTNVLWIDISGGAGKGIPKYYYNGSWYACQSIWG